MRKLPRWRSEKARWNGFFILWIKMKGIPCWQTIRCMTAIKRKICRSIRSMKIQMHRPWKRSTIFLGSLCSRYPFWKATTRRSSRLPSRFNRKCRAAQIKALRCLHFLTSYRRRSGSRPLRLLKSKWISLRKLTQALSGRWRSALYAKNIVPSG